MQKCLDLAVKGKANVAPNPMVGCVVVLEDKIIGQGYHELFGQAHAEVNAIKSVFNKSLLPLSTLYVNLEPCAHFGKTPPCASLIIEHKIQKVVIGCVDTFSKVSGKGIAQMQTKNIDVISGVLENECRALNKRFFTFHEQKRPYIILKWASSSDGYIAPKVQDDTFWMTSIQSKKRVHQWRSEEMGILVGTKTAINDNPSLTVRDVEGKNPIRFVLDKNLRLTNDLALFNNEAQTFIFTENATEKNHIQTDFTNLAQSVCNELYQKGIQSIIIEGGRQTLQSFIDANLWDEARVFTAPINLKDGTKAPDFNQQYSQYEQVANDHLKTYYR